MIWVDYAILSIIAVSTFVSLMRGFVREAVSLATWIAAFWIAIAFSHPLAPLLSGVISVPSGRVVAAFVLLLLTTLVLGAVVNYLIGRVIERTGLSGTDRMLGAMFGVARGVIIIAVLVLLAGLTELPKDPWWKQSLLLGHFQGIALWLRGFLPPDVAKSIVYE